MKIGIIGAGISGLACADLLHETHDIVVFEAAERIGGHTNTVRVDFADETHQVDTGFIVFNERNYPNFTRLLAHHAVPTQAGEMSFSVSRGATGLEYRATSLNTLYARRANVVDPGFTRMLVDIVRFNRSARRLLDGPPDARTLGELIDAGRYGRRFVSDYLVPIGASIWSADPTRFTDMPAVTFARFFDNHGLLGLGSQPQWRTITGGSDEYVKKLTRPFADRIRVGAEVDKIVRRHDGVEVHSNVGGPEQFDHVVLAVHSDQALRLLGDPSDAEGDVLGAIPYQPNVAVLHTDRRMLPRRRRVWASWNYHLLDDERRDVAVTYWMNSLQNLTSRHELCVTLNRQDDIAPETVIATFEYQHPVIDARAVAAQRRRHEIQGRRRTWFCGAYWGYGFHEDGVRSAIDVCRAFGRPSR